ncbi:MAG TPA: hypothetical protein VK783_14205 [Bacteroidia bacterium]|jgi:hypothetical protein|nr:hypothetical protein [Bacteroidia bacterium]
MKKLAVALALLTSVTLVAQNNAVTSAARHMEDFEKDHDTNDLIAAKTFIDQAAVNEKTMNEAKTYLYRGLVYQNIFENQVNTVQTKMLKANPKTPVQDAHVAGFAQADTTALGIAVMAYLKCIQIDPKSDYADEAKPGLMACGADMLNKAIVDKNNQNYGSAVVFFGRVIIGERAQGMPDTSKHFKQLLQSAAFCAEKLKNYPLAINYYNQMTAIKGGSYSYADIPYSALYRIYLNQNDTNDALAAVAKGRAAVPDNLDLLNDETNGYLWRNQSEKAEGNLQLAIDKLSKRTDLSADEKNLLSRLYFILGTIYDNLGNPRDDKHNLIAKPANYEELFNKADTNYKMALKISPDFYEPHLNLGAMYLNRIQVIYDKMNALTAKNPKADTKALDAEARSWLLKAQPYLEQAHTMKPDDHDVKVALLKLYANTGQDDKAKALTEQK